VTVVALMVPCEMVAATLVLTWVCATAAPTPMPAPAPTPVAMLVVDARPPALTATAPRWWCRPTATR